MSDFKVNCSWQGLELTIYAHVRDGDCGPCAYQLGTCHGEHGNAQIIQVEEIHDQTGIIWAKAVQAKITRALLSQLPHGKCVCRLGSRCETKGFQRELYKAIDRIQAQGLKLRRPSSNTR